jgi:hypothetical protein
MEREEKTNIVVFLSFYDCMTTFSAVIAAVVDITSPPNRTKSCENAKKMKQNGKLFVCDRFVKWKLMIVPRMRRIFYSRV